jgi:DNA-binding transcriptional regulator YiaG
MKFKELRQASGMNQTKFAEYFKIPRRTVQNWELGTNKCPDYLLELMHYKLQKEGFILIWRT